MPFFRTLLTTNKHMLINFNNVTTITRSNKSIKLEFVNHSGFGTWLFAFMEPITTTLSYSTVEDAEQEFERMEDTITSVAAPRSASTSP